MELTEERIKLKILIICQPSVVNSAAQMGCWGVQTPRFKLFELQADTNPLTSKGGNKDQIDCTSFLMSRKLPQRWGKPSMRISQWWRRGGQRAGQIWSSSLLYGSLASSSHIYAHASIWLALLTNPLSLLLLKSLKQKEDELDWFRHDLWIIWLNSTCPQSFSFPPMLFSHWLESKIPSFSHLG